MTAIKARDGFVCIDKTESGIDMTNDEDKKDCWNHGTPRSVIKPLVPRPGQTMI